MTPTLGARGLAKRYGALRAVDGVDLAVAPGEVHGLIGPNGAGKSTLLALLAGELRPDSGEVRFDSRDVTAWSADARARAGLARTFQVSTVFLRLTALENAALAAQARSASPLSPWRRAEGDPALDGAAMAALDGVGLAGAAHRPAAELAYGKRRALEVAMALAASPRLLLLDEPMAGMGAAESRSLVELLGTLKGRLPMLLVEHDVDAVWALADRVSVMVGGRILASGTPAAVRADPEVRRAYLGEA